MQKGFVEVYDVTRLVDDFSSEEYRENLFKGKGLQQRFGTGCKTEQM